MTADWPPSGPPEHEDGQLPPATLSAILSKLEDMGEQLTEIYQLLEPGRHHPGNHHSPGG